MALDVRIAGRKKWRVGPPIEEDPEWVVARIALELDTGTTVALRLSSEEAVHIAKKLLAFAARDVGLKVEGAFEPLVNLANRLGRALEK